MREARATIALATLLLVTLLLATPPHPTRAAASDRDLVEAALEATFESDARDHWAFTRTTTRGDTTTVHHFNPRRPEDERWRLVAVDGRPPTEAALADDPKRRAAERQAHERRQVDDDGGDDDDRGADEDRGEGDDADEDGEDGGEGGNSVSISSGLDFDDMTLLESTPTHALYRVGLTVDASAGMGGLAEYLEGTLRIDRRGPFVEELRIRSPKPFSPRFMVKIREFDMRMTFGRVEPDGPVVPRSSTTRIEGRAMVLKSIDERVEVRFGDYERVD